MPARRIEATAVDELLAEEQVCVGGLRGERNGSEDTQQPDDAQDARDARRIDR